MEYRHHKLLIVDVLSNFSLLLQEATWAASNCHGHTNKTALPRLQAHLDARTSVSIFSALLTASFLATQKKWNLGKLSHNLRAARGAALKLQGWKKAGMVQYCKRFRTRKSYLLKPTFKTSHSGTFSEKMCPQTSLSVASKLFCVLSDDQGLLYHSAFATGRRSLLPKHSAFEWVRVIYCFGTSHVSNTQSTDFNSVVSTGTAQLINESNKIPNKNIHAVNMF